MATYSTTRSGSNFLGLASLIMGGLGLVFYFFQPFGIVLGAAGVAVGIAGVAMYYRRGGTPRHLAVGGLIMSLAALATGAVLPVLLDAGRDYTAPRVREGSPYTAPRGEPPPPFPKD
jgi:hypothetical protein